MPKRNPRTHNKPVCESGAWFMDPGCLEKSRKRHQRRSIVRPKCKPLLLWEFSIQKFQLRIRLNIWFLHRSVATFDENIYHHLCSDHDTENLGQVVNVKRSHESWYRYLSKVKTPSCACWLAVFFVFIVMRALFCRENIFSDNLISTCHHIT